MGKGLKGFERFSEPETGGTEVSAAGVEKSISNSSSGLLGDLLFPLPVLCFFDASKAGIALGGVRGTVGFNIDFKLIVGDG